MSIITGTGCALPADVVKNEAFTSKSFYDKKGNPFTKEGKEIVAKLEAITGIKERRFVPANEDSVPIMVEAALNALKAAGLDKESLDGIIVAHNAGNMIPHETTFHTIPNLAARLKNGLGIMNHDFFAYDILFGCPGWLQGIIQAHQAISTGDANHVLVIGVEVISKMNDPHDVDSMIFADGCGATILSASQEKKGVLSYATFSHALDDLNIIYMGKTTKPDAGDDAYYVKMNGPEVYRYATRWLPRVIKKSLDRAGITIAEVDMFLFHQANEKMLHAIARNIAEEYGISGANFDNKIPMTIHFTGNSSVATIPTMMDLILKNNLDHYSIAPGDTVVMASVGAGMHCNSMVYQF